MAPVSYNFFPPQNAAYPQNGTYPPPAYAPQNEANGAYPHNAAYPTPKSNGEFMQSS